MFYQTLYSILQGSNVNCVMCDAKVKACLLCKYISHSFSHQSLRRPIFLSNALLAKRMVVMSLITLCCVRMARKLKWTTKYSSSLKKVLYFEGVSSSFCVVYREMIYGIYLDHSSPISDCTCCHHNISYIL